ncbi:MFS transporter [Maribellus maritimus]|uniref:MFS transporter n=1 Tax=Maribellus maritimus TaxID=2870838 RepID=UPI001EEA60CA|nr:MFS transporter [Maribellus maritimus]MCG6189518.1 MFS transporter [Maribellus maritimus]
MRNTKLLEVTLLLASMLTILANAIIAPSLPLISRTFEDVRNVEILTKLMLTLPALTIALVAPLAGRLLDKIGRIKVLYISLLIYLLAGTSGYWLGNLFPILVGRVVFGLGVAGIMTVSTTLIGDYFTGAKREHFMGLQGAFVALGGLIFITAAGVLTDINWRLAFLIYGFSAVVLVLVPFALHEPKIAVEKNTVNMQNGTSVSPVVWLVFISAFITTVSFYMIPVQLPFFLQKLDSINGNKMGLALGSLPFAQAIASFYYKRVKKKFDFTSIYSLGFIPMAIGFLVIGLSQTYLQTIAGVLISGLGVGILIPNGNLWMINLVPFQVRGKYVGFLTTATFLGMFFSPIIIQPIQNMVGISASFIVLAVALAILSIVYFIIQKRINNN